MMKRKTRITILIIVEAIVGLSVLHFYNAHSKAPVEVQAVKHTAVVSPCKSAQDKTIIVSISKQRLWACNGSIEVKKSPVTTGMTVVRNGVNDKTPTGTWTLQAKYRDLHLRGTDANGSWDDPVKYWMPFDQAEGIGFHDASWQTFPFGSSQYHTDGSHGCVHLPTEFISWLYDWSSIGTTVIVQS